MADEMEHCARMKHAAYIALIALTACGTPAERAAERALREGAKTYRAQQYDQAASIYALASFDPRVAYNLGNTLYRRAQWDTAMAAYGQAIASAPVGPGQARAFHNLGNGWMHLAAQADTLAQQAREQLSTIRIEGEDIGRKVHQFVVRDSLRTAQRDLEHLIDSALVQGAEAYKNALRRSPEDEDARHNLALAQGMIAARVKEAAEANAKDPNKDKDKGLSERAKLIMQKADELVEQHLFKDALKVMTDGLKADPTLKQQQEYMHKLDVVTKAAEAK